SSLSVWNMHISAAPGSCTQVEGSLFVPHTACRVCTTPFLSVQYVRAAGTSKPPLAAAAVVVPAAASLASEPHDVSASSVAVPTTTATARTRVTPSCFHAGGEADA